MNVLDKVRNDLRAFEATGKLMNVITVDEYVGAVSSALVPARRRVEYLSTHDMSHRTFPRTTDHLRADTVVINVKHDRYHLDEHTVSSVVPLMNPMYEIMSKTMSPGSGNAWLFSDVVNDDVEHIVIVEDASSFNLSAFAANVHVDVGSDVTVFLRQAAPLETIVAFVDDDVDIVNADPDERWRLAGAASMTYAGIVVIRRGIVNAKPQVRCERIVSAGRIVNRVHRRAIDYSSCGRTTLVALHDVQ